MHNKEPKLYHKISPPPILILPTAYIGCPVTDPAKLNLSVLRRLQDLCLRQCKFQDSGFQGLGFMFAGLGFQGLGCRVSKGGLAERCEGCPCTHSPLNGSVPPLLCALRSSPVRKRNSRPPRHHHRWRLSAQRVCAADAKRGEACTSFFHKLRGRDR